MARAMERMEIGTDIVTAFSRAARAYSGRAAIIEDGRTLSYAQLQARAQEFARRIAARSQGRFVGIVMDHGADMIAAILGALMAGKGYVPIEPDFPPERIGYILGQAEADLVVTQCRYRGLFDGGPHTLFAGDMQAQAGALPQQIDPEAPAYVLYTSGTTGFPKGVMVAHRNLCHYVRAFQNEFHPGLGDVMLQNSVCTFDIFVEEVFPILLSGGALAIADVGARGDFDKLLAFIKRYDVTMVSGFPYLMIRFNHLDKLPGKLRLLISGGDVLRYEYVKNLLGRVAVYNTYGPSETTVCATYFRCGPASALADGTFPVGRAVTGARVRVLDESLRPVPQGQVGEICIYGGGVSLGYLKNSAENAAHFARDPETGERLYRSGDLGRVLPDGELAFLERKDQQVMILGKRVEPMEVENVLNRCPGIEQAVVESALDEQGLSYLTAYLLIEGALRLKEVRAYLGRYLPAYMVPEFFVKMESFPKTSGGKVDRRALPVVLKEGTV